MIKSVAARAATRCYGIDISGWRKPGTFDEFLEWLGNVSKIDGKYEAENFILYTGTSPALVNQIGHMDDSIFRFFAKDTSCMQGITGPGK